MGSQEKKTILQQGQKLAKELNTSNKKKRAVGFTVETNKASVGFARKYKHGQVGIEVEVEKDQRPKIKGGGSFNWD